jgi:hypothetical protein
MRIIKIVAFLIFFIFLFVNNTNTTYGKNLSIISNNTWSVYENYNLEGDQESLLGKAEEINFPGTSSFENISPDSKWIWAPNLSLSSSIADLTTFYFYTDFYLPIGSSEFNGKLTLVVDDYAEIYINDNKVGYHGSIIDVNLSGNQPKTFDFTQYLHAGKNHIVIKVQNGPAYFSGANCTHCTWQENPAGLLLDAQIAYDEFKLPISYLNQTDMPWGIQIYDNATKWSPGAVYIKDWGCALTVYSMILRYFGFNLLPNGEHLNPGSLNQWLKQHDGFIDGKNTGYINPLALTLLSKQAVGINKITSFDALEYSRDYGSNFNDLKMLIKRNIPVILDVGGHYVLAYGIQENTFNILDPFYRNKTLLSSYPKGFNYLGFLKPSNTDLSYILVATSSKTKIELLNNEKLEGYKENALENDRTNLKTSESIKLFFIKKPQTQKYKLRISSLNSKEEIKIYLYDEVGNYKLFKETLSFGNKDYKTINIVFDKENVKKSKINHGLFN